MLLFRQFLFSFALFPKSAKLSCFRNILGGGGGVIYPESVQALRHSVLILVYIQFCYFFFFNFDIMIYVRSLQLLLLAGCFGALVYTCSFTPFFLMNQFYSSTRLFALTESNFFFFLNT